MCVGCVIRTVVADAAARLVELIEVRRRDARARASARGGGRN